MFCDNSWLCPHVCISLLERSYAPGRACRPIRPQTPNLLGGVERAVPAQRLVQLLSLSGDFLHVDRALAQIWSRAGRVVTRRLGAALLSAG